MENISQRLKLFRKKTRIKIPVIEKETGISRYNLYKWEKGTRPSSIDAYQKLKAYLDLMENVPSQELATSISYYSGKQIPATVRIPLDPNESAVVQVEGKESAGTIILFHDKPELIVDRIDAPFLGKIDGVVEVTGDSMEPTYIKGCRIAIARLHQPRLYNCGNCYYIIDKNWIGMIRRVYYETRKSIRLDSDYIDQSKYPPIIRQWDEIEAIFQIKAIIQKS